QGRNGGGRQIAAGRVEADRLGIALGGNGDARLQMPAEARSTQHHLGNRGKTVELEATVAVDPGRAPLVLVARLELDLGEWTLPSVGKPDRAPKNRGRRQRHVEA